MEIFLAGLADWDAETRCRLDAIFANSDLRQSRRTFSTTTDFWKVPDKQDYERSYENENDQLYPGWNGHGGLTDD